MNRSILFLGFLFFIGYCKGQNLVSNGSFESKTGSECPAQTGFDHGYPTDWSIPFHGYTPDYFYPCIADYYSYPGTPYYSGINVRGCQYPLDGQAYAGFGALIVGSDGYVTPAGSEYILHTVTLTNGQTYKIEFWVSRAEDNGGLNNFTPNGYTASVKTLGMYLTTNSDDFTNISGSGLHNLPPQIPNAFPAANYYTSANWTKISGTFTATLSGTWYIVIGNFDSGINSNPNNTPNSQPSSGDRAAFYFVDAITIIPSDQTPPSYDPYVSGVDLICDGSTTYTLNNVPFGTTATWAVSPSNLYTSSSGSGTTASLTAAGSGGGLLTFTLSGVCQSIPVTKYVWVGAPETPVVMVWPGITMSEMNCNSPEIHQVYPTMVDGTTIQWYAGDSWSIIGTSTGEHANIRASGSGYANVTFTNICGSTSFFGPDYDPCSGFLVAYPNPASESLNVALTNSGSNSSDMINEVILINEDQKTVFSYSGNALEIKIPTASLEKGTYFLRATLNGNTEQKRILIQ